MNTRFPKYKKIERVVFNIGGMQGDIEGVAGMTLPRVERLELSGIDEDPTDDDNDQNENKED